MIRYRRDSEGRKDCYMLHNLMLHQFLTKLFIFIIKFTTTAGGFSENVDLSVLSCVADKSLIQITQF